LLHASQWFFCLSYFLTMKMEARVPLKFWLTFKALHNVVPQKTEYIAPSNVTNKSTTRKSIFCAVCTDSYVTWKEKITSSLSHCPYQKSEWVKSRNLPTTWSSFSLPTIKCLSLCPLFFTLPTLPLLFLPLSLVLAVVFSAGSIPRLYHKDQHDKPVSLVLVLRWWSLPWGRRQPARPEAIEDGSWGIYSIGSFTR
jgi:hypothetical protein